MGKDLLIKSLWYCSITLKKKINFFFKTKYLKLLKILRVFQSSNHQSHFSIFLEHGIPTSVDFIGCDPAHMVASFNTGSTVIYDLETSQSVVMLSSQIESGK